MTPARRSRGAWAAAHGPLLGRTLRGVRIAPLADGLALVLEAAERHP